MQPYPASLIRDKKKEFPETNRSEAFKCAAGHRSAVLFKRVGEVRCTFRLFLWIRAGCPYGCEFWTVTGFWATLRFRTNEIV